MASKRLNGIPVIYVSGTHYEVGYTIGRTFKSMIQELVSDLKEFNTVSLPCYESAAGRQIYEETLNIINENFPQYVREIQGTADGAEVPFYKLMLLHMDQIVPKNTLNISTKADGEGCTSILCNGGEEGIIGHTEDALPETLNHIYIVNALIREDEPQGRWGVREERFSALCYAGHLPGFCMGWNHHGLIFTINVIFPKRVLSKKTPRHILTRALLAAPNMETAQKILRDSGVGSADGFSVNFTFLRQDGDRVFHNAEVAPAYNTNESILSILTLSPGEHLGHCNKYHRLQIEEDDEQSSEHRRRVINAHGQLRGERDVIQVLSDKSDSVFPIFREGDRDSQDFIATVAVGIFNCEKLTWSLYINNPEKSEPLAVLPIHLKKED